MIEYVLDTDVLSELRRERLDALLETRIKANYDSCAIPAPVVDELQFRICRLTAVERRRMYQLWLETLIVEFPVIPLDGLCAQWHGRERARLVEMGKAPSLYDGLIASIAVVNELVLVTHNTADFSRFSGIRLDDWMGPRSSRK
jgi:tRNA(fMet)-specific endonuclease VapC